MLTSSHRRRCRPRTYGEIDWVSTLRNPNVPKSPCSKAKPSGERAAAQAGRAASSGLAFFDSALVYGRGGRGD